MLFTQQFPGFLQNFKNILYTVYPKYQCNLQHTAVCVCVCAANLCTHQLDSERSCYVFLNSSSA